MCSVPLFPQISNQLLDVHFKPLSQVNHKNRQRRKHVYFGMWHPLPTQIYPAKQWASASCCWDSALHRFQPCEPLCRHNDGAKSSQYNKSPGWCWTTFSRNCSKLRWLSDFTVCFPEKKGEVNLRTWLKVETNNFVHCFTLWKACLLGHNEHEMKNFGLKHSLLKSNTIHSLPKAI